MLVGIDLGTTNSLVAGFIDGKPVVIPNRLGKLLTPSVVAVDEMDRVLVGEVAKEYGYSHPFNMAKVFKRTMGTDVQYLLGDKTFRSEELSSLVLRSLKEDAEVYLKCEVDEAIISVPAYFDDNQRSATKKAGELAGLRVSRIISEPTASAIAYGVGSLQESEMVMVFDLGGGTFDVSILDYFQNIMEVHAIAGDNQLGGEDFTAVLIDMFQKQNNINPDDLDLFSINNIYKAAEACKCGFAKKKKMKMSCVANNTVYDATFTLEEYKQNCQPLLERIKKPIEKSLHDADVTLADIDRIILVGGATRLPIISEFVQQITGINPDYCVNPDLSVAEGAALQCGMKMRDKFIEEVILTDVCPFTLGTEVVRDNGSFVETGHYLPIIDRNTVIPVSKKQTVYTAYDNQDRVDVKVLQGESRLARNNIQLGMLSVDVPVGPKGQQAIEITYTYDINSLLEVEVKVLSTGVEKKAIIKNQNNTMSDEEIQQRLQLLSYLKLSPRDEEENILVLSKGERLYQQTSGQQREEIEQALFEFEKVLAEGSRSEIRNKRNELLDMFDEIDNKGFMDLLS